MENILNNIIIIIQARTSSSRLPNKILLPIYKDNCIIDILLHRFLKNKYKIPICLATTNNPNDDKLFNKYKTNKNILCYRGDENNVLSRFIECSKKYKKKIIIRVCSDNPFLSLKHMEEMIEKYIKNDKQIDYLSFSLNKKPSILTHIGFFSELVTVDALMKINENTSDSQYLEHVTNYIYNNSDKFNIKFINIDYNKDIRLTVDTDSDFLIANQLFNYFNKQIDYDYEYEEINNYILNNKVINSIMCKNIYKNKKMTDTIMAELIVKLDNLELKKNDENILIIGEIGQNHNGDMSIAKKLIDVCEVSGVKIVKFQKRYIDGEFTNDAFNKLYDNPNSFGETYGEHRNFLELNESQHLELKNYANEKGIIYFCTPCDIESVKMLERINCPFYKIASRDITNIPLLEYIGKLNKTVIISTGMAEMEDIDLALKSLNLPVDKVIIMQCTSEYPCPIENANLNVIKTFNEKYKNIIGFSDHTDGVYTALCSVFCGAKIIEKHITLSRNMKGTDHAGSLEPDGLKKLAKYIKNVQVVMGSYEKELRDNVSYSKKKLMKSLTSNVHIKKGTIITEEMLCLKCPGNGILWKNKDEIIGKIANTDIDKDKTLKLEWFK